MKPPGSFRRPNGSRLSCGAKFECTQTEFYNTACRTYSGSIGDGAASFKRLLGGVPGRNPGMLSQPLERPLIAIRLRRILENKMSNLVKHEVFKE